MRSKYEPSSNEIAPRIWQLATGLQLLRCTNFVIPNISHPHNGTRFDGVLVLSSECIARVPFKRSFSITFHSPHHTTQRIQCGVCVENNVFLIDIAHITSQKPTRSDNHMRRTMCAPKWVECDSKLVELLPATVLDKK